MTANAPSTPGRLLAASLLRNGQRKSENPPADTVDRLMIDGANELDRLCSIIESLELRDVGRQSFLAAYRTHRSPTEKAFKQLDRAKKKLAKLNYEAPDVQ